MKLVSFQREYVFMCVAHAFAYIYTLQSHCETVCVTIWNTEATLPLSTSQARAPFIHSYTNFLSLCFSSRRLCCCYWITFLVAQQNQNLLTISQSWIGITLRIGKKMWERILALNRYFFLGISIYWKTIAHYSTPFRFNGERHKITLDWCYCNIS